MPVFRLLTLGEVALLAGEHLNRLDRYERRRLVELVRIGRGRRRNLNLQEREELRLLLSKLRPWEFTAHAANKLSPLPIPRWLLRRLTPRE